METYTKLYSSCVVPTVDYCCTVWFYTDTTKVSQLQNLAMHMGVHKCALVLGVSGDCGWPLFWY